MTPLLPIETLRKEIGYNRYHFWQLTNSNVPVTSSCNGLIFEYSWQDTGAAGRSETRAAIETAEAKLLNHLHYRVAPQYVEETISYPRPFDTRLHYRSMIDRDGRWLSVQLPEGYIQALGIETLSLIGTVTVGGGSLVYSDLDGDGIQEAFTATIATTVTDTDEIAIYFASGDRLDGESAGERWRIQPIKVSISGGTATVRGNRYQLVKPILYEGENKDGLDPDTAANFVTSLEVYRRYTNPNGTTVETSQATLIWETPPWPSWACCGGSSSNSSTDPAAIAMAIARAGIRDSINGIVTIGQSLYDTTTSTWYSVNWDNCREPDRVILRYLAGYPLESGQMASLWRPTVARFAAAELQPRIQACEVGSHWLWRWQFDLSRAAGANDEQYQISEEDLNNPFGSKAGQVDAWKRVKALRNARGFLPG